MRETSLCEMLSDEGIRRFLRQTLGKISRQGKFRNVVIPCDVFNCYWAGEGEKILSDYRVELHLQSKQSLFNSPLIHRFLYWIMARAPSQVKVDTLAYAWTAAPPIENQAILLLSMKKMLMNVRYTIIGTIHLRRRHTVRKNLKVLGSIRG